MNPRYVTPALFVAILGANVVGLLGKRLDDPVERFAALFIVLNILWLLLEIPVTFRVPAARPREVATLLAYGVLRFGTVTAAVVGPLPWHLLTPFAVLPLLLFGSGVVLRLVAIRVLGRFYSHHVIRRDDHAIVRTGPYRVIRHPAYAGMMLGHLGLVLFFLNPLSVPLFLALTVAIGWRIRVEERELLILPAYREYATSRPRLLPGVW
ncbi:MAG TPA: isoprenylcysteine carboxylmethyltransferase family protein [Pseudonocardiaceae bacterium]|nr:isoprenylcysteine carboxylmethyltransferase family protein [Pseudonocardiaceae bacterium]